jgi:hypothetical protein
MPATHASVPPQGRGKGALEQAPAEHSSGERVPTAGGQPKPETPNMTQHPKTPAPADNTEKY